ncbi:MAG TPA: UDP-2,4-diacetamido-2,4,6-trideoxy-beta-L-altropyranose hydrolase, partial [Labilithrix sp.]|nr:UDP-2,4-diacetamido-2,4,6-trideoxy-beta-L-altropyranose hydrolase [Labilithrix sp.]
MIAAATSGEVLLVRADASATIGLGHVMRCLALAEAWLEGGGAVTFAMSEVPDALVSRIERAGARVARVAAPEDAARLARELGARFAVVDGYHLGAAHQDALAGAGTRLLVVDDAGETATAAAALVLNQNAHASPSLYGTLGSGPELLLGLGYVLLRREFRASGAAPPARITPELARRVLVTFGGADTAQLTPRALEALAPLDGLDVLVLAGAANPHASELRPPAGARATVRIEIDASDMAEKMRWADLALIAAGSTSWELAACGVPMIAVVAADNQRGVAAAIA